ncbi:Hypothetical protein ABZS17I87_02589 [Kosakonia cowanii]
MLCASGGGGKPSSPGCPQAAVPGNIIAAAIISFLLTTAIAHPVR